MRNAAVLRLDERATAVAIATPRVVARQFRFEPPEHAVVHTQLEGFRWGPWDPPDTEGGRPAFINAMTRMLAAGLRRLPDRLLQQVDADGLGVLAISHDQALLDAVADEVVDLADLAAETTPALGPTADPARS